MKEPDVKSKRSQFPHPGCGSQNAYGCDCQNILGWCSFFWRLFFFNYYQYCYFSFLLFKICHVSGSSVWYSLVIKHFHGKQFIGFYIWAGSCQSHFQRYICQGTFSLVLKATPSTNLSSNVKNFIGEHWNWDGNKFPLSFKTSLSTRTFIDFVIINLEAKNGGKKIQEARQNDIVFLKTHKTVTHTMHCIMG